MTAEALEGQLREKIREAMKRKRLSQADLARALGVSPSRISVLVSGKRGRIPEALVRMLDYLDLEICVKERKAD